MDSLNVIKLCYFLSCIPVPIHIEASQVKSYLTPNLIEPSVSLMMIFYDLAMRSIAKRSIC